MKLTELKKPLTEAEQAAEFHRLVESRDAEDLQDLLEELEAELATGEELDEL